MENKKNLGKFRKLNLDEREIVRLYTEKEKTCKEVAEIFNCSVHAIHNRLKQNNINTSLKGKPKSEEHIRKRKETMKKLFKEGKLKPPMLGKHHTKESNEKNREAHKGKIPWNKRLDIRKKSEEIIQLYKDELMNVEEIGKIFECSPYLIKRILKENNSIMSHSKRRNKLLEIGKIPKINSGSLKKGHKRSIGKNNSMYGKSGPLSPSWQGGLSFEPYGIEFNDKLRRAIRKRDNQVCMLCGIHREKLNRGLSVHHINYNKQNNLPQNLISLCRKCHMKTNFNREIWTKHIQLLLNKLYNYKYSEEGKIILKLNNGTGNN